MVQLKLILSSLLICLVAFVFAEDAYFEMVYGREAAPFVFKLTDSDKISKARNILSGEETTDIHVMGRFKKTTAQYNPRWSYHLDPNTIGFFHMAIEVCDSSLVYLEDHLDEACGAFLPGCIMCPWQSKLTREIKLFDSFTYNKVYNVNQFILDQEEERRRIGCNH